MTPPPGRDQRHAENAKALSAAIKNLNRNDCLPRQFQQILLKYLSFCNPSLDNLVWISQAELARKLKYSTGTVRHYLRVAEQIGAIQVCYRDIHAALADISALSRFITRRGRNPQQNFARPVLDWPGYGYYKDRTWDVPEDHLRLIQQAGRRRTPEAYEQQVERLREARMAVARDRHEQADIAVARDRGTAVARDPREKGEREPLRGEGREETSGLTGQTRPESLTLSRKAGRPARERVAESEPAASQPSAWQAASLSAPEEPREGPGRLSDLSGRQMEPPG
jgi:hypothetical protein